MKFSLLSVLILFITTSLFAQFPGTDSNWFFGEYAGLTWNQLQANQDPMYNVNSWGYFGESSSVISDSMGNLMFYTGGITVYCSDHTYMPGSMAGSPGGSLNGDPSSTQGAQIIPKPNDPNVYYIFTADNNLGINGICYSKIDMTLNSGLGDIDLSEKNIPLLTPACEKITYAAHANGIDIWVIVHGWDSNAFYSFLVSPTGIGITNPIISNVGSVISGTSANTRGYMRTSYDASRIAVAIEGASIWEIYDFDRTTGVLSNPITISNNYYNDPYGVEFSPDGHYLYGSERWGNKVRQWDISLSNSVAINASMVQIAILTINSGGALLLGPDSKIYMAVNNSNYIARINAPNSTGLLCDFIENDVLLGADLASANTCKEGLPSIYRYYAPLINNNFVFSETCDNDTTFFSTPLGYSIDSAFWNFNYPSVDPLYNIETTNMDYWFIYPEGGQYTVQLVTLSSGVYDTMYQDVLVSNTPIVDFGPDTNLCPGETLTFDFTFNNSFVVSGLCEYYWEGITDTGTYTNTSSINIISQAGQYNAFIYGDSICGSVYDTLFVTYSDIVIDFGVDTVYLQQGNSVILVPGYIGGTHIWSTGQITPTIEVSVAGYYSVTITDVFGCEATGGVTVIVYSSINKEDVDLDVELYPNPASDNIHIDLMGVPVDKAIVYNFEGNLIKDISTNQSQFSFSVEELPQGVYFIRFILKNNQQIVKTFNVIR